MDVLFIITGIVFFVWVIRNIFFWTALWQLKEYRLDRILVHFRETSQGRRIFFSPFSLLKWIILLCFIFVIFNDNLLESYEILVAALFIAQFLLVIREIYFHLQLRPVFTYKALAIIVTTLFIISVLFAIPLFDKFFWLLLLDRLVALLVAFFVFLLSFPSEIARDIQVEKAKKKLKRSKDLLIIAVTGSYGKSSTKEYIAQILGKKFNVVRTKGTNNTPIGIANTILRDLKKNTQILVVEMGAYKQDEIYEMCQITRPEISVITAVNQQHLSLFGSLENTMKAKYEIVEALPRNGLALFNGNNKNVQKLYMKTKKKKVLYKVTKSVNKEDISKNTGEIAAYNINFSKTYASFDVAVGKKTIHLRAPLLGIHAIENILPGIYIADHLGMSKMEIKDAVSHLLPLPKTLTRFVTAQGVVVVDDTFNANPDAVTAAIQYVNVYQKRKFLVLQPMIELGKEADEEHYRVTKKIAGNCDYLLLTNNNFNKPVVKGIQESKSNCQSIVGNAEKLATFLIKNSRKGDVIIFEGKEAGYVLEK